MTNIPSATIKTLPRYATMALLPTLSSISPPIGIQISVLGLSISHQPNHTRDHKYDRNKMTYAKLTMEYVNPNRPPTSLAFEICPIQAGARLRNEPDASPNTEEKVNSPARVLPKGNHITKTARAPSAMSAAWVFILP
jgi:hypothetical protein